VSATEQQLPPGARPLGRRLEAALRISLGYQGGEGEQAIVKTDHFRVNDDSALAEHWRQVHGAQPTSLPDLILPSSIRQALTISYVAFKGGRGKRGVCVAWGDTNFAELAYCGGPDTLTVRDVAAGTVERIETAGLDALTKVPLDALAHDLGLELVTTFRFMDPAVLPYGEFAEITTRSKKSTDALWAKLREWYGQFGASISFVIRPELFLRESTVMPAVEKDGKRKFVTSKVYVLDLRLPETQNEMLERAREYRALSSGEDNALYGPRALGPGPAPGTVTGRSAQDDAADPPRGVAESEAVVTAAASDDVHEPDEPDDTVDDAVKVEAIAAAKVKVHFGKHQGRTLGQVYQRGRSEGWFKWLLTTYDPQDEDDLRVANAGLAFCRYALPSVYQEALASRETK